MKNVSEKILELLRVAETTKSGNDRWITLGELPDSDIDKLTKILNIDVSGFTRIIDVSSIKHVLKAHPNMKDTDFCLIPLILDNPDSIEPGKKPESVIYTKTFKESYYYVEYIRKGRKKLAMKTFYKTKNRPE